MSNPNQNNDKVNTKTGNKNDNLKNPRTSSSSSNGDNNAPPENTIRPPRPPIKPFETEGVRYGKCKWFNVAKGWGFITPNDGGQEVFVHQSVIQMGGFRSLGEQEDVEFECKLTKRGLEASRVSGRQGTDCHGSTFRPRGKKRNRRFRCYNCGEFANHIASKCNQAPQPKRCHLCKSDDHLFANCPSKKNTSRQSDSSESATIVPQDPTEEDR